jgi:hypothetical protein
MWRPLQQGIAPLPTHDPTGGLSVEREMTMQLAAELLTGFSSANLGFFELDLTVPWH